MPKNPTLKQLEDNMRPFEWLRGPRNYAPWSSKIKSILQQARLEEYLEHDITHSAHDTTIIKEKQTVWRLLANTVNVYLLAELDPTERSPYMLWKALEEIGTRITAEDDEMASRRTSKPEHMTKEQYGDGLPEVRMAVSRWFVEGYVGTDSFKPPLSPLPEAMLLEMSPEGCAKGSDTSSVKIV